MRVLVAARLILPHLPPPPTAGTAAPGRGTDQRDFVEKVFLAIQRQAEMRHPMSDTSTFSCRDGSYRDRTRAVSNHIDSLTTRRGPFA